MRKLKPIIQTVVLLAAAFFIGRLVAENWNSIQPRVSELRWEFVLLGLLFFTVSFIWQTFVWRIIATAYSVTISWRRAWFVYMKAAVARYIPGNVWGLAAKGYVMTGLGLKRGEAFFVIVLESAVMVFTGILVYFFFSVFLVDALLLSVGLAVLALALFVVVLYPRALISVFAFFKREAPARLLPARTTLAIVGGYIVYWLLSGAGFVCTLYALGEHSSAYIMLGLGVYAASWVVGFIVLIAPSGAGVRELSMVYLLGSFLTVPVATAASVLARLLFIGGEVAAFGIGALVSRAKQDTIKPREI